MNRSACEHYGWLPLMAGLAMTRAVAGLLGCEWSGGSTDRPRATLKWPNDVLIDGLKVAGLLAELLPDGTGAVMGAGLNLAIPATNCPPRPRPRSPCTAATAETTSSTRRSSAYLRELRDARTRSSLRRRPDAASARRSATRAAPSASRCGWNCPAATILTGTAVDLDESGRLRIKTATDAPLTAVAAGDVTHVR